MSAPQSNYIEPDEHRPKVTLWVVGAVLIAAVLTAAWFGIIYAVGKVLG